MSTASVSDVPARTWRVSLVAVCFASASAGAFALANVVGFRSTSAELLSTPLWMLGVALLLVAALLAVTSAAGLAWRLVARRRVRVADFAAVLIASALVAVVVASNPLWGSGGGSA